MQAVNVALHVQRLAVAPKKLFRHVARAHTDGRTLRSQEHRPDCSQAGGELVQSDKSPILCEPQIVGVGGSGQAS